MDEFTGRFFLPDFFCDAHGLCMAGEEEDSWISMFEASGSFDSVEAQIAGLGSIDAIQQLYVAHTADAMKQ